MFEKNVGRKNMKVVDRLNFSNREALPKIILNILTTTPALESP